MGADAASKVEERAVEVVRAGAVARVRLARPKVHNAFNAALIGALGAAFAELSGDASVRAIVLEGEGPSFCAGGDLRWMRESAALTFEENVRDARGLAKMLQAVDRCPKPVIAKVHGLALGGGTGLLSCCDIVIAARSAQLGLSEVRLGLVPGVISPFVVRRTGEARARALMLTGERISAERAHALGLIDEVVDDAAHEEAVQACLAKLLEGSPAAQAAIKELCRAVADREPEAVEEASAHAIARARASDEGREGTAAFLEKRAPRWKTVG